MAVCSRCLTSAAPPSAWRASGQTSFANGRAGSGSDVIVLLFLWRLKHLFGLRQLTSHCFGDIEDCFRHVALEYHRPAYASHGRIDKAVEPILEEFESSLCMFYGKSEDDAPRYHLEFLIVLGLCAGCSSRCIGYRSEYCKAQPDRTERPKSFPVPRMHVSGP